MAIVVAEKIIEMVFIMLCVIVLYKTGLIDYKIPILPDGL